LIYEEDGHEMYLLAYKGIIYKVLKKMNMNALGQFNRLEQDITASYGPPVDISQVREQDRKNHATYLTAIAQGKSDMVKKWMVPNQIWHVELAWNKALGITLSYKISSLEKKS